MSSQRFAPEFKDEAVRQVVERGYPVGEVAQRLGASAHSLYKWVKAVRPSKVGWTKARLNELIKGKRGVTAKAALDLAEALGTSPRLWMNLQATFDLGAALQKRRAA